MDYNEETIRAIELLEAGVPKERVQELFHQKIHPNDLQELMDDTSVRNESRRNRLVDPNIKRLVDEMRAPEDFMDPLFQHLMRDPIALSSGHIFDRTSVLDSNGELKFRKCPLSGKNLSSSVVSLIPKRRQIEHFKATRDRNVTEVARKMISSGDYESFHSVLEGVEDYIKGLGDNYLTLARELVAMWSGVREASGLMLMAENVVSQGHSRAYQPIVASGGLQDKAFRIIVSTEHFRDQSPRRDERSGVFLSLFNERDLLVERCKLFDFRSYSNNTKNHHVFGKHDPIVTKSKPGYSYKLEYKASEQGFNIDVQGLMCKIFPESGRRPSYRMKDADGEEGIYMGSVDLKSRAHGAGVLDYDDGRRLVGSFHQGSVSDGVLFRGAHVVHTMEAGDWSDKINEALIQKYQVGMLVYDSSDKSYVRGSSAKGRRGESGRSNASVRNDDGRSHRSGYNRSNPPKRPGMVDLSDDQMFVSALHTRDGVSNRGVYEDALPAFRGKNKLIDDIDDISVGYSNSPSKIALPVSALPAFRGNAKFIDDVDDLQLSNRRGKNRLIDDIDDMSSRYSNAPSKVALPIGILPALRGNGRLIEEMDVSKRINGNRRMMNNNDDNDFGDRHESRFDSKSIDAASNPRLFENERIGMFKDLEENEDFDVSRGLNPLKGGSYSDDLGIPVAAVNPRGRFGEKQTDDISSLGDFGLFGSQDNNDTYSVKNRTQRYGPIGFQDDLVSNRDAGSVTPSVRSSRAKMGAKSDSLGLVSNDRGEKSTFLGLQNEVGAFPALNRDGVSGRTAPYLGPVNEDEESHFGGSNSGNDYMKSLFPDGAERLDQDETSSRRGGIRFGSRGSRVGGQGLDSRDVTSSNRSHFSNNSKRIVERPMLLLVDDLAHPTKGGNYKKLVKGGTLQEGVSSIIVSAEKFKDTKGMSRIVLTLYNDHKQVVQRKDVFGSPSERTMKTYVVLDSNSDSIVADAKAGYCYQLEYKVTPGFSETITISGLICKIYPESRSAPSVDMKDPEGTDGRYRGQLDLNANASGKGIFDYRSGFTFVGEFKKGKFVRGAYYRALEVRGTMKDGKWDQTEIDKSLIKEFPYEVHFHSRLNKTKKSIMVGPQVDEPETFSVFCCL